MRYPAEDTAEKHERILHEASRLFRERGFEDVTVAEVMKAAGLTHGAFYSHFPDKESLVAAAVEYAMQSTLRNIQGSRGSQKERQQHLDRYLSPKHRDNVGLGCAMAAFCGELRHEPEAQTAFTIQLKEIIKVMGGKRGEDIARLSAMVGAVALSRAVSDEKLSDEILRETRNALNR